MKQSENANSRRNTSGDDRSLREVQSRGTSHGTSRSASAQRSREDSHVSHSRSSQSSGRGNSSRKKRGPNYKGIIFIVLGVLLLIAAAVFGYRFVAGGMKDKGPSAGDVTDETIQARDVLIDGTSITITSKEQAKQEIMKLYPWKLTVKFETSSYEVPNLITAKIDNLMDEVFSGVQAESYSLDTSGLEEEVKTAVQSLAADWDKPAQNGLISGYDAATDTFLLGGEEKGVSIDKVRLAGDISQAVTEKRFDAVIEAVSKDMSGEAAAETGVQLYKTLGTYTTDTTANKARNTNIDLSCKALNGVIIQPGEEFSFNDSVGQRTTAKGYKGAAAYNNGEVVEEIGGGVCQVSTTLYNAVLMSGLEITKRQSHTFEPSYVTPGQDATVSWGGPDFKFRNNSKTPIGIRASYGSQKVTLSIFGIPILEDGVEYSLSSKKLSDLGVPAPTYVEDPSLAAGVEVTKKNGSRGSQWEVKLIIKKDGIVISSEVDHKVTYKGHAPVVARNTLAIPETTPSVEPSIEETTAAPDIPNVIGPGAGIGSETQETKGSGPGAGSGPSGGTSTGPSSDGQQSSSSPGAPGAETPGTVVLPSPNS